MKLIIKKIIGGYNDNNITYKKIKIYKGGNQFIKSVGGESIFCLRDILLNINHINLDDLDNKSQRKILFDKLNEIFKFNINISNYSIIKNSKEQEIIREIDYLLKLNKNQFIQVFVKRFRLYFPFSDTIRPLFMLIKNYYENQVIYLMNILNIDHQQYLDKWTEIDKKNNTESSSIILFQLGKDKKFIDELKTKIKEKLSNKINNKILLKFIDYITDKSKWDYIGFCPLVPVVRTNHLLDFPLIEIFNLIEMIEGILNENLKYSNDTNYTKKEINKIVNLKLYKIKKIKLPYRKFKIPEKKTLTKKSKKKINKHDLKTKIEKLILKLDNSKDSLIKWENYYIENAELFSIIYKKLYYIM